MKQINSTHLKRHCTRREAYAIVDVIGKRINTKNFDRTVEIDVKDKVHLSTRMVKHFDAEKALEVLSNLVNNHHKANSDVTYEFYRDVMRKALDDRIKYGDKVPGTTDIYIGISPKPRPEISREFKEAIRMRIAGKKDRQHTFKTKWNKLNWDQILKEKR